MLPKTLRQTHIMSLVGGKSIAEKGCGCVKPWVMTASHPFPQGCIHSQILMLSSARAGGRFIRHRRTQMCFAHGVLCRRTDTPTQKKAHHALLHSGAAGESTRTRLMTPIRLHARHTGTGLSTARPADVLSQAMACRHNTDSVVPLHSPPHRPSLVQQQAPCVCVVMACASRRSIHQASFHLCVHILSCPPPARACTPPPLSSRHSASPVPQPSGNTTAQPHAPNTLAEPLRCTLCHVGCAARLA